MHAAATSKVENSAQGSSCKLKFVHALPVLGWDKKRLPGTSTLAYFAAASEMKKNV